MIRHYITLPVGTRRALAAYLFIGGLLLLMGALSSGCSSSRWSETYGSDGALTNRVFTSTQLGTTRQSEANFEQLLDGHYSVKMGEDVRVDPKTAEMGQFFANALLAYGGLSQGRRGDALAPISIDSLSAANGFGASPITAEQQAVYIKRLETQLSMLEAKLEAEKPAEEHHPEPAPPPATGGVTP